MFNRRVDYQTGVGCFGKLRWGWGSWSLEVIMVKFNMGVGKFMVLKEFYIEDKYGVESSSWHDEKSEFRTECLVFDGG